MTQRIDVVVVGAGQAGLTVSGLLAQEGVEHVVLERGRVGETWRTQRWDSFCLNTPNWANALLERPMHPGAPDAFSPRDDVVAYLGAMAGDLNLPIRQHVPVTSVTRTSGGEFAVRAGDEEVRARAVVFASGSMNRPRIPSMARRLGDRILNLSAGTYRNAGVLPQGAVVVVGCGQSGCQIAEDLIESGRKVFLCASRVARCPRMYRGRDILTWWAASGFLDVRVQDLPDPAMQFATQPQVSGTHGGHVVSLQSLARAGATLLGRVVDCRDATLTVRPDLMESIRFADERARQFREAVDAFIVRHAIAAPDPEPDPGEPSLPDLHGSDQLETLDLRAAEVSTIVWCTGFEAGWDWVHLDVFDDHGRPRHASGITDVPGAYFIGFPWLSSRKSGILYGVSEDAGRVVDHLRHTILGSGRAAIH